MLIGTLLSHLYDTDPFRFCDECQDLCLRSTYWYEEGLYREEVQSTVHMFDRDEPITISVGSIIGVVSARICIRCASIFLDLPEELFV